MIHYYLRDINGRIFRVGSNTQDNIHMIAKDEGGLVGYSEHPVELGVYYWGSGRLIEYPPKPDPFAVFDYRAGVWLSRADAESAAAEARALRSRLLSASDWTQVPDAPADSEAWKTYRKSLRDITAQDGFPFHISWPEQPK